MPALPPVHTPLAPAQLAAAPAKMREAARNFEAQALSQLLQPAFAGLGAEPLGRGGAAEAQWRTMLVDAVAGAATRAGSGLGIADMALREMLRRQSADPTTTKATTAEDAT
ncbi:MAG: rod-binding protein [Acetobacteraceae bacterium]|nr:rod-binding protein [Acetobacteraceae bacterium]